MKGYLHREELLALGAEAVGTEVYISKKASLYSIDRMRFGDNVRIDDFCVVSGNVHFGSNIHLAVFSNVAAGEAGVSFGDFSGLSYGCHVFAQSDDYSGRYLAGPIIPERYKCVTRAPVRIGRYSMVGAGSLIFPGVELAEGTAVGAMSMVKRSTKPWSIYAGIPARRVKAREQNFATLAQQFLEDKKRGE